MSTTYVELFLLVVGLAILVQGMKFFLLARHISIFGNEETMLVVDIKFEDIDDSKMYYPVVKDEKGMIIDVDAVKDTNKFKYTIGENIQIVNYKNRYYVSNSDMLIFSSLMLFMGVFIFTSMGLKLF